MSWDIVIFNSDQKIISMDEVDESLLRPIDFDSILTKQFKSIILDDHHVEIKGDDFIIDYFLDDELVSNKMFSLYGERGLYELVTISKTHNWQIFDTSSEKMIDFDVPDKNGYQTFQRYLQQIQRKED
jgi:hypothetical protein